MNFPMEAPDREHSYFLLRKMGSDGSRPALPRARHFSYGWLVR